MKPTQQATNNGILRAPEGMDVFALPVTRMLFADGTEAVASYWRPNEHERALLAAGAPVRLLVIGVTHPPLQIGVSGDGFGKDQHQRDF